ncbi:MAG: hypothetical protein CBARDMAM_0400 [uncultured Caballeronia sp.]|nr:MAG: hypothetical protein CBARDMAM_0400 [uncultured Caballeronia sp.]
MSAFGQLSLAGVDSHGAGGYDGGAGQNHHDDARVGPIQMIQSVVEGLLKPWRAAERLSLTTRQVTPGGTSARARTTWADGRIEIVANGTVAFAPQMAAVGEREVIRQDRVFVAADPVEHTQAGGRRRAAVVIEPGKAHAGAATGSGDGISHPTADQRFTLARNLIQAGSLISRGEVDVGSAGIAAPILRADRLGLGSVSYVVADTTDDRTMARLAALARVERISANFSNDRRTRAFRGPCSSSLS